MSLVRGPRRWACPGVDNNVLFLSRWSYSDEEFEIGAGTQVDFTEHLPILKDRLFLSSMKSSPSAQPLEYYLSLNRKLRYVPFCADFGESTCAQRPA